MIYVYLPNQATQDLDNIHPSHVIVVTRLWDASAVLLDFRNNLAVPFILPLPCIPLTQALDLLGLITGCSKICHIAYFELKLLKKQPVGKMI